MAAVRVRLRAAPFENLQISDQMKSDIGIGKNSFVPKIRVTLNSGQKN